MPDRLTFPVVVLVGLVIGVTTVALQAALPAEIDSITNSAGSWSLAAFLLAFLARDPRRAAVAGALALAAMIGGYVLGAMIRDIPVGPRLWLFWTAAAVVVGPILGVGAAWVRGSDPRRAAIGIVPIAAILVGEGIYGLTRIADTTSPVYWVGSLVAGIGLVAAVIVRRRLSPSLAALAVGSTALGVGLFVVLYSGDLIGLLPL